MKLFREIRKKHEKLLRSVRNHSVAHKDHDAGKQLQWIESLDLIEMVELSNALLHWTNGIASFLLKLVKDLKIELKPAV